MKTQSPPPPTNPYFASRKAARAPKDVRGVVLGVAMGGLFVAAAASQLKLQMVERSHTIDLANKTNRYELSRPDAAKRGTIYSSDGQPLAIDEQTFDLNVDFDKCPKNEGFWLDLAQATGIPATEFEIAQQSGVKSKSWPQTITADQKDAVDIVRSRWRVGGASASPSGRRTYPFGSELACLVGVERKKALVAERDKPGWKTAIKEYPEPKGDKAGYDFLTGLEESMDPVLRGKDGVRTGVTDKQGHFLPMRIVDSSIQRKDGEDITLTIDSGLQQFASEQVRKAVETSHADCGTAVIEDPKTGEILALANWPSFEPYTADGSYASLGTKAGGLNQTYMTCLEPGSMFKILTLAKALDAGVVKMTDTFDCPGEKVVIPHARPIKCDLHHGTRAQGLLTPVLAIAKSCNIWAATWARDIGYVPFTDYLKSLDLFAKPDLGVPGAVRARFDWDDPAKQLQLANLGFGQAINATPVSLIGAFSTLANGGVHIPPHLISRIGGQAVPQKSGQRVLTKTSCDDVIQGMEQVFENEHGTGHALRIPNYLLAGKTGTAQKVGKGDSGHVSNFIGFVPAQNPKVAILVMVNRPQGQLYYGAELAGPVWRSIAQEVIRRYHIPPTRTSTAPMASKVWAAPSVDVSISVARKAYKGSRSAQKKHDT